MSVRLKLKYHRYFTVVIIAWWFTEQISARRRHASHNYCSSCSSVDNFHCWPRRHHAIAFLPSEPSYAKAEHLLLSSSSSSKWIFIHAHGSCGVGLSAALSVCLSVFLFFPARYLKNCLQVTITKIEVEMFHYESWQSAYFGVSR